MIITIEVNMDAARIAAAMVEIKREGSMRRGVYPKLINKGTLVQVVADSQIKALADAYRVLEAAVIATEELPFFADSSSASSTIIDEAYDKVVNHGAAGGLPSGLSPLGHDEEVLTAAPLAVLPYDKTKSLTKGAPTCRFCGHPGTRSKARSADVWTCDTIGCTGAQGYVPQDIFQGGVKP